MKPTNNELEILKVLWAKGPSTVRVVNEETSKERAIGYTTTLKMMQIMHEKGLLEREKNGKTHVYSPLVSQESTEKELSRNLLKNAFGGSAKRLVMSVLGNNKSTPRELQEIREYLEKLDKNSK